MTIKLRFTGIAILIILFFLATCLSLEYLGKSARSCITIPFEKNRTIYLAHNTSDLYHFWKKQRLKGVILVNAGRYLHYESPAPALDFTVNASYPLRVKSMRQKHEQELSYRNYLWNALNAQMARKLYYVLPADDFRERFSDGMNEGKQMSDGSVPTHELGKQRIIGIRMPDADEPVILNLDATFLASSSAVAALEDITKLPVLPALITICLSEDNPDVRDEERRLVKELQTSAPFKALQLRIEELPLQRESR